MSTKQMSFFDKYLTVWVAICMAVGVGLGKLIPDVVASLRSLEFGAGSRINIPIAVLIWLMVYPIMLKVDFGSVLNVGKNPKGLFVTRFGPESGAALACVVGVLVEVPVMLSVCSICNRTRHWFAAAQPPVTPDKSP